MGPRRIIPAVIRPTATLVCRILGLFSLAIEVRRRCSEWFGQNTDGANHWLALSAKWPFDVVAEFQCLCDVYKCAGLPTLRASLPGRILAAVAPTYSKSGVSCGSQSSLMDFFLILSSGAQDRETITLGNACDERSDYVASSIEREWSSTFCAMPLSEGMKHARYCIGILRHPPWA